MEARDMKRAVIAVLILAFSIPWTVAAEGGGERFAEASLMLSDIAAPLRAIQTVKSQYRHNGNGNKAVHYYGYVRRPISAEGIGPDKCYPYMCYGTGEEITVAGDNMLTFDFNPQDGGIKENDCIYFSFYYRSAARFTDSAANDYEGTAQRPEILFNNNELKMNELCSGNSSLSEFVPDGKWRRVEYYLPLTAEVYNDILGGDVSVLSFRISFLKLNCAAYIELGGMRCGTMRLSGKQTITNKKAYTYLGELLQAGKLRSLKIDGESVALKDGVYEYTVDPSGAEPEIEAENVGYVKKAPEIIKKKETKYEVKAYSANYDELISEPEPYTYMKCVDENGNFDENGTETAYTVENAEQYSIYTVRLNMKAAQAVLTVNGKETTDISGCGAGDIINIGQSIRNIDAEDKTYITLLIFYQDGTVTDVVTFKTDILKDESGKDSVFTFVLGDGDYSGGSVDCLVIDTSTFADVLR